MKALGDECANVHQILVQCRCGQNERARAESNFAIQVRKFVACAERMKSPQQEQTNVDAHIVVQVGQVCGHIRGHTHERHDQQCIRCVYGEVKDHFLVCVKRGCLHTVR